MDWKVITDIFILVYILGAILYDFIVIYYSDDTVSISGEFWNAVKKRPFIAFLFGYLCGHLTWQMG